MPIPDFQSIMLSLLELSADMKEHTNHETRAYIAKVFQVTKEEQKEMLPSGLQEKFTNRVAWALAHLKSAGLMESKKRGSYNITKRGIEVLKSKPEKINVKFLNQFPGYKSKKSIETQAPAQDTIEEPLTPDEIIRKAYDEQRKKLSVELLELIKRCKPDFFERLVVELLVKMGYGGSMEEAGSVVGRSGDGGIDGIIKEDKLGLDFIYIQAKKWENTVGRPEIQKFAGALMGKFAKKGVFITTSNFTKEARNFSKSIDSRIVLIDGEELSRFMIDFDLGVAKEYSLDIKRIDSDYFEE